ncbi:ComF family protein [Actinocatenispora rupis]|uniref:Phosphoribosyltransferase domain-containing protein n=1 Tax=Actinocatenispora rupis TaxID=519421 RepID=A0A8J3IXT9_9ACTN|nr:phosphoribosyltransferase family protein [Actinocatenispora rupis]GID10643.1 hypothetical protein Aru02nite_15320 [Actinocatenispora rupis]
MSVLADVLDLVFPADCPGCGSSGPARPLCPPCALALGGARPFPTVPDPPPPDLPPCATLGRYEGVLRELVLAYKERGRIGLAGPLGRRLGDVVAATVPAHLSILLVPVPATPRAVRARHGDHVLRLARHAARSLRRTGRVAVVHRAVRAVGSLPDSTELSAAGRLRRARDAFRPAPVGLARLAAASRPARAGPVVLVDDIVTTGATLAATARVLHTAGVPVGAAVVLAATRRRRTGLPAGE